MVTKRAPPPKKSPSHSETESEEEESSSEEEDQQPKPSSTSKNPQPSSESGDESESETGSESESDEPNGKVVAKEDEAPKGKALQKPDSSLLSPRKPSETAAARSTAGLRSGGKRAVSETQNDGMESERVVKKKKGDEDEGGEEDSMKAGDDAKKPLPFFQRLWSEEDVLAVLSSMLEFSSQERADPTVDMNAFHEFVKNSLHCDVSKVQVADKIRRLKKKYENNASKERGGFPTFNNPHEERVYDLSKEIWGSLKVAADSAKANGKAKQDKSEALKTLAALKAELLTPKVDEGKVDQNPEVSFCFSGLTRFQKNLGMTGMDEHVIKRGLELMDPLKRFKLEERWKNVYQNEMELIAKRAEVAMETIKMM